MRTTMNIEEKTRQLLSVLNKEEITLEKAVKWLDQLREFIIKRDSVSLDRLLKEIRSASDTYAMNEYARQNLRRELSGMLEMDFEDVCLSAIADYASEDLRQELLETRQRLSQLGEVLKKKGRSTAMLVREYARLNTMMLNKLLQLGSSETMTYNADGRTGRSAHRALMNYHF